MQQRDKVLTDHKYVYYRIKYEIKIKFLHLGSLH